MAQNALARTVRRLSWVDVLLVGPLAVPGVSHLIISLIGWLDAALGLNSSIVTVNPMGMLFMNVVGVLAISWCIVRIQAPSVLLARLDILARLAVSALILYYMFVWGVTAVLLVFLVSELIGAVLEWRALRGSV